MSPKKNVKYGFFSAKSAKEFGYLVYSTKEGFSIKVTEISSQQEKYLSNFDDIICLGEIDKYLYGKIVIPKFNILDAYPVKQITVVTKSN